MPAMMPGLGGQPLLLTIDNRYNRQYTYCLKNKNKEQGVRRLPGSYAAFFNFAISATSSISFTTFGVNSRAL